MSDRIAPRRHWVAGGLGGPYDIPKTVSKTREEDLAFSRGVLVALGHVSAQFEDTMYDEIIIACDPKRIVEAAQDSEFDLAHLRKNGWATKGGRLKRKRL